MTYDPIDTSASDDTADSSATIDEIDATVLQGLNLDEAPAGAPVRIEEVNGEAVLTAFGELLRYEFDDAATSNTAIDSTGTASATISGATYSTNSEVGSHALSFDGTDDFVEANSNQNYGISDGTSSAFTISAYVNWAGPTERTNGIFDSVATNDVGSDNPPYGLALSSTGIPSVVIQDTNNSYAGYMANSVIPQNQWVHLTGEFDGSEIEIYIDGSLDDSATRNVSIIDAAEKPVVGVTKPKSDFQRFFNGLIDDVFLFDRKITDSERQRLINR